MIILETIFKHITKNIVGLFRNIHEEIVSVFEGILIKISFDSMLLLEILILIGKFFLYSCTLALNIMIIYLTGEVLEYDDTLQIKFGAAKEAISQNITAMNLNQIRILENKQRYTYTIPKSESIKNLESIARSYFDLKKDYKEKTSQLRHQILIKNVYLCLVSYFNMILTEIAHKYEIKIPPLFVSMDLFFFKGSCKFMVGNLLEELKEILSPSNSTLKLILKDHLPHDLGLKIQYIQRDCYGDIISKTLNNKKVDLSMINHSISQFRNLNPDLIISGVCFTDSYLCGGNNNNNLNSDYYYCVAEVKELALVTDNSVVPKWTIPLSIMTLLIMGSLSVIIKT